MLSLSGYNRLKNIFFSSITSFFLCVCLFVYLQTLESTILDFRMWPKSARAEPCKIVPFALLKLVFQPEEYIFISIYQGIDETGKGGYTCRAENKQGNSTSNIVTINIKCETIFPDVV